MITTILLVIGGAIIYAIIGTIWYSNATPMGKIHMRYLGMDKLSPEELAQKMQAGKAMMPKMYAAQMGLSLLTSFWIVLVVTESVRNGLPLSMGVGFSILGWLCFMVPSIGTSILWSNCDRSIAWKKFFSDIASNLVTIIVIALVVGLFV
ncbi:MAG TPA: DUF1761 family protein [Candidatus Paceibacterota bacterium]|nr:DUF1761 family protein [Candidatus Paceibacterota bacterium]